MVQLTVDPKLTDFSRTRARPVLLEPYQPSVVERRESLREAISRIDVAGGFPRVRVRVYDDRILSPAIPGWVSSRTWRWRGCESALHGDVIVVVVERDEK